MRVAVIGSRSITCDLTELLDDVLPDGDPGPTTEIVSGGAHGVDTSAEKYARKRGIPITVMRPDYLSYGKKAPLIRNEEIVAYAEFVVSVWDGCSRGTVNAMYHALRSHKPLLVCKFTDNGIEFRFYPGSMGPHEPLVFFGGF